MNETKQQLTEHKDTGTKEENCYSLSQKVHFREPGCEKQTKNDTHFQQSAVP